MNIQCWWCNETVTKLGDLSSVSEVGAGLFLGLTVIQLIGAGQISRMQRRAARLRTTINSNNLNGLRNKIGHVDSEILRAEVALEAKSFVAMIVSFILLIFSLVGLSIVSLYPDVELTACGVAIVLGYFLAVPPTCFVIAALVINHNCKEAKSRLKDCSRDISQAIRSKR